MNAVILRFLAPALMINFFSLMALWSLNTSLMWTQLIKLIIALGIFFVITKMRHSLWQPIARSTYGIVLGLLVLNLILLSGIRRWVKIFGMFVQFSAFAKIGLILMLADFLYQKKINLKVFAQSMLIIAIPAILIFKQPNLGTALIFLAVGTSMIWYKGIPRKIMVTMISGVLISLPVLWSKMLPYQKMRVLAFLNPMQDPQGSSYQTIQSIIAIGSGGIFGSKGLHNKLGFVPENHTDFLFAYFAEKFGFFLTLLLIFTIFFGIFKLLHQEHRNQFKQNFVFGFTMLWLVESVMNIGMNLGLLPVTGISLPCFSYGGSSLIAFFIGYAIVFNLLHNRG